MKQMKDMNPWEKRDNIVRLIQEGNERELDLEDLLYDICKENCEDCSDICPVYRLNSGVPDTLPETPGCDCKMSGRKMRQFIKDPSR